MTSDSGASAVPGRVARVLGLDGCRAGWVGIVLSGEALVEGVFGATFADVIAAAGPVDVIGVDMPVHPPDSGARPADLAARAHLGRKASSVFLTPTWPVLAASSYTDACAVARAADGKAISRQAWGLRAKILEVDAWVRSAPGPVHEVHPEVSFSVLVGAPIIASKRTWAGLAARWRALERAGISVPSELGAAGPAAADDVLDAAVVAWTARRIAAGEAQSFPDPPVPLPDGRVPAIWA